jgi:hypothetical protein
VKNRPRDEFRKLLENVKYRGYEVEQLSDGRKIVLTKPGGKLTYGRVRREDFMVWVYDPADSTLWLISHRDIFDDLKRKGEDDPETTVLILDALERVYNGEDPDDVLSEMKLAPSIGDPPDLLLKTYKWIWGQEDCNYPEGKGRAMSWEGWEKKGDQWVRTGRGLTDLREDLKTDRAGE